MTETASSVPEKSIVLPSLKNLIEATKNPNFAPIGSLATYPAIPMINSLAAIESPTKANFEGLYENFLKTHHTHSSFSENCKISDHILKFNDPPTYQRKSFAAYDIYKIIFEFGGMHTVLNISS
jgi:hypothetical protein